MRILYLTASGKKSPIPDMIRETGNVVVEYDEVIISSKEINWAEYIISYGYRHILNPDVVKVFRGKIINVHISLLPWNRGADPNLWSWIEDTPKGVTIHYIDEGIDTGPIIIQSVLHMDKMIDKEFATFALSYALLEAEAFDLFRMKFISEKSVFVPEINSIKGRPQNLNQGSFHKVSDAEKYKPYLIDGWNTRIGWFLEQIKEIQE